MSSIDVSTRQAPAFPHHGLWQPAELSGLMARIVDATLAADESQAKWALQNMHACHPENGYGALATIDQMIDDLNAFRGQIHMAAWQSHVVRGRA